VITWKNVDAIAEKLASVRKFSYLCSAEDKKGFLNYGKIKHSYGD
jgi:hypothetical protein